MFVPQWTVVPYHTSAFGIARVVVKVSLEQRILKNLSAATKGHRAFGYPRLREDATEKLVAEEFLQSIWQYRSMISGLVSHRRRMSIILVDEDHGVKA